MSDSTTVLVRLIGGVVHEIVTPPPGLTLADILPPADLEALVEAPDDVREGWLYDGATFTAPPAPALTQAQVAEIVLACAGAATNAVIAQVVPDQTHLTAYLNAASCVGPSATVPTVEPLKSAFGALASANGFGSSPAAFASLVVQVSALSLSLSALLTSLTASTAAAKTAADLAGAVQTFESGLSSLVAALNAAGLTVTISAPAAIKVAGLNA